MEITESPVICFAADRQKFIIQCILLLKQTSLCEVVEIVAIVADLMYCFSLEWMLYEWCELEHRIAAGFVLLSSRLIETGDSDLKLIAKEIEKFYPKIQRNEKEEMDIDHAYRFVLLISSETQLEFKENMKSLLKAFSETIFFLSHKDQKIIEAIERNPFAVPLIFKMPMIRMLKRFREMLKVDYLPYCLYYDIFNLVPFEWDYLFIDRTPLTHED
jgi:hypothetical protein